MTATHKFSWLHFTDLHVGMAGSSYLYPNIEETLFEDLAKQHKKSGPWDAIFFTGDLVQKGSEQEFAEFDKKMKRLMDHLKVLGSDPVFLAVPGNHDLVRPDPDSTLIAALSSWSTNPKIRETFWAKDDSEYRKGVNSAFSSWTKWTSHGIGIDRLKDYRQGILPGDFSATLECGEISIGVLGLNTAALQLSADDYIGKLSLHPRQIEPLFPDSSIPAWIKAHNACFLLTHHPLEWLDNDGKDTLRGEIAIPGRFALHLCGHL
jgi:predicted MPP superfamily phosphohydrolase